MHTCRYISTYDSVNKFYPNMERETFINFIIPRLVILVLYVYIPAYSNPRVYQVSIFHTKLLSVPTTYIPIYQIINWEKTGPWRKLDVEVKEESFYHSWGVFYHLTIGNFKKTHLVKLSNKMGQNSIWYINRTLLVASRKNHFATETKKLPQ